MMYLLPRSSSSPSRSHPNNPLKALKLLCFTATLRACAKFQPKERHYLFEQHGARAYFSPSISHGPTHSQFWWSSSAFGRAPFAKPRAIGHGLSTCGFSFRENDGFKVVISIAKCKFPALAATCRGVSTIGVWYINLIHNIWILS